MTRSIPRPVLGRAQLPQPLWPSLAADLQGMLVPRLRRGVLDRVAITIAV